jgi:hypothetical protein
VRRGRRPAAALLLALAAAGLPACGRKGSPVAPELRVPHAVGDLGAVVRDGAVALTWTVPRHRLDNTRLTNPGVARLFRAEDAGGGEPRAAILADDRIAGYSEVAAIRLAPPGSPFVSGGAVAYEDRRGLALGRRYTYVVVTADTFGRASAPSRRVSVTYLAAAEPPAGLTADAGEREIRLTWQPPARLVDGTPAAAPLVYEVLRAASPDAPLGAVGRTAPGVTTFTDRGLENDRTYAYAVRAIRTEGAAPVEGEPSRRVTATPVDLTPPPPPRDLVAIPSERTVRLSWGASPGPDVVAYVVYRADAEGALARIGRVPAPQTTFVDRDVPPGRYRYGVTAQEGGLRANESAPATAPAVSVP